MVEYDVDIEYLIDQLVRLLCTPSPTGNTEAAISLVEDALVALGLKTERTNKGALVAILPGRSFTRPRALSGHIDTLGAMVKEIKRDGRLKLAPLGGYSWLTVEGEYFPWNTSPLEMRASGKLEKYKKLWLEWYEKNK